MTNEGVSCCLLYLSVLSLFSILLRSVGLSRQEACDTRFAFGQIFQMPLTFLSNLFVRTHLDAILVVDLAQDLEVVDHFVQVVEVGNDLGHGSLHSGHVTLQNGTACVVRE